MEVLQEMRKELRDGWDGQGSLAPLESQYEYALKLLFFMKDVCGDDVEVGAGHDGELDIVWKKKRLYVTIHQNDTVEILQMDDICNDMTIPLSDMSKVKETLLHFASRR